MHLLVTGGAGFIGSHLATALLRRGDSAVIVDDLSFGSTQGLPHSPGLKLIRFRLGQTVPDELGSHEFDAIIHLAGQSSVRLSWEDPLEAHDRNVTATVSLLEFCGKNKIPRFILASSAAVYGTPESLPIGENSLCSPLSPYGLQKLACEHYLKSFSRHYGFSGIALRLFNVYGPRQQPNSSEVISTFLRAIKQRRPMIVEGDGTQTRDFIFVDDVVWAISSSVDIKCTDGSTQIFNIGTGTSHSVLEVAQTLLAGADSPNELQFVPNRSGDISHSQADITAARSVLGFEPQWSLSQGLETLMRSAVPADA